MIALPPTHCKYHSTRARMCRAHGHPRAARVQSHACAPSTCQLECAVVWPEWTMSTSRIV
eukprot:12445857-Alexandrium_andersonii.AAC.1